MGDAGQPPDITAMSVDSPMASIPVAGDHRAAHLLLYVTRLSKSSVPGTRNPSIQRRMTTAVLPNNREQRDCRIVCKKLQTNENAFAPAYLMGRVSRKQQMAPMR